MNATLQLRKMSVELESPVRYSLRCGDNRLELNDWLEKRVALKFSGVIHCVHCDRLTRKSFNQGYCYPCFTRLAQCDSCIVSPEKCHYDAGTCREPEWGEQHCMRRHYVYLANSSGIKVGITREENIPSRWIDQGAVQALPMLAVDSRYQSGLAEVIFKAHVADKTNWRTMLKGDTSPESLTTRRDELLAECRPELLQLQERFGLQAVQEVAAAETVNIEYPVLQYPRKIVSHNLDKEPLVEGVLQGIKGQYLILDTGVLNVRKFASYEIELEVA